MREKRKFLAVISTVAFVLAVASISLLEHRFATTRRATPPAVFDASGKPINSLFAGLPVDPGYSEFKRIAAEHKPACGANLTAANNTWERLSRTAELLGISTVDPVVHADGCGDCGYRVVQSARCAGVCGGLPYDGDLEFTDETQGIENGAIICKNGVRGCGEIPTVNCLCDNGDDDDDDDGG
jgi:hypothetical protein